MENRAVVKNVKKTDDGLGVIKGRDLERMISEFQKIESSRHASLLELAAKMNKTFGTELAANQGGKQNEFYKELVAAIGKI